MRSVSGIILEQARLSRERALFYRQLSKSLSGNRSVAELERCARDLEERAQAMEDFARRRGVPEEPRPLAIIEEEECEDGIDPNIIRNNPPKFHERNIVRELRTAVAIAFAQPPD